MELKVLFIEDDEKLGQNLQKSFEGVSVSGYTLRTAVVNIFEEGISEIDNSDFDLVVLDLYKDKDNKDEEAGIKVLNAIRKSAFIPVVFYTGHAYKITNLISEVVGVVSKGDGIEALTKEIERIVNSKIAVLKSQIYGHLRESLRKYFWETVDADKTVFVPGKSDVSLGYLLLRRFANSLSKENIKQLLGDDKIKTDKAHPMEFYIFPSSGGEYEAGEILHRGGVFYTVLTPTCDFIEEGGRPRKVGKVLLGIAIDLKDTSEYKKFIESKNNTTAKELTKLIESRKSDRYFFLPGTPFLPNLLLDFQNKAMHDYDELKIFSRVAKLDDPYAQSMVASFIRYYNRIGFPDIDADYVIQNL
jgi:ActR/RegA family two-component response regulator